MKMVSKKLLPSIILILALMSPFSTSTQILRAEHSFPVILSDGQFVFGPNVGDFDIRAFLSKRNDPFGEYADEILAQADYFSINPRVLLVVLRVLYGNAPLDTDFPQRIHETAHALRSSFSWHRYNVGPLRSGEPAEALVEVNGVSINLSSLNSASYAIASAIARQAVTKGHVKSLYFEFSATYRSLFPDSDPLDNSNNITPPGPPPSSMLQLPFPRGAWWKFNGPHNKMGVGHYERPWSSMDFGLEGSCAAPPDMWAVAAAAGYIQRRTTQYGLRIDHGNGWQTAYYHLRDIWGRFNPDGGDYVTQNMPLGRISCLHDPNGFADVPHVHFSLLYNGEFIDISRPNPSGDRTRLSGYQVYEGSAPYQGKLIRERETLAYNYVYNDGGSPAWASLNFTVRLKNNASSNHSSDVAVVVLQPTTNQILWGPTIVRTDVNGYYSGLQIAGIQPGYYHICTKAKYYLGQCAWNVYVGSGSTINIDFSNNGNTPAWPGDIDRYGGDNEVNALDREMFFVDFRSCPGCSGQFRFDFNRDGVLQARDWSIMLATWTYHPKGDGVFNRPFPLTAQVKGPAVSLAQGSISIQPDFATHWVGDTSGASIVIDTGGNQVTGVDAKVFYDPGIFEVLDGDGNKPGIQITPGNLFPSVYKNEVDTQNGIIHFTAGYGNDSNYFNGAGTLATISFRAIAGTPPLLYTTIMPIANADTPDDSNGSQYNTAIDILQSSQLASYIVHGTPTRASPSITISPGDGLISQDLLSVEAQVNDPYNQVECVHFGVYPTSGDSVSANDCDPSDGWGATLDISRIPDQAGVRLKAWMELRTTPGDWKTAESELVLDRTPPNLNAVFFTPYYPLQGDIVRVDLSVSDNVAQQVYAELWVNTANDSSEYGDWILVDAGYLSAPNPVLPNLWWNTSSFSTGSHLIAIMLRDDAGNVNQWTTVRTIMVPFSSRIYLPAVVKQYAAPLITNGDFENGPMGWVEYSTHGWSLIMNSDSLPVTPHSGNWATWLGGDNDEVSYISQEVRVPAGQPYLTYWHWIASEETGCNWDYGKVVVNEAVVDEYGLCSSTNTDGWVPHSVNLGAYIGQLISIQIRAETDSSVNSNLFIDDVSFSSGPLLSSRQGSSISDSSQFRSKVPK